MCSMFKILAIVYIVIDKTDYITSVTLNLELIYLMFYSSIIPVQKENDWGQCLDILATVCTCGIWYRVLV